MKVYLRKIFNHDITHEVSVLTDVVRDFFDGETENIPFYKKDDQASLYLVDINSATDPRFGGNFKNLLRAAGDIVENDIVSIRKKTRCYDLEIIKQNDNRHEIYSRLFAEAGNIERGDRHQVLTIDETQEYEFNSEIDGGVNHIVYGTPGCGKSFYVENTLLRDYPKTENGSFTTVIRTTFYADYTNSEFVGQILPVRDNEGNISYDIKPGPFTLALELAIKNPDKKTALVIEELNRGNAPGIFGDLFQLLDREETGRSRYEITNVTIQDYLTEVFRSKGYKFTSIRIPGNLSIYATMNTSDQNVYTLDTAFKRRWKFEKLRNKFDLNHEFRHYCVPGMKDITWEDFVDKINDFIVDSSNSFLAEDKQIGVYFVDKDMLVENTEVFSSKTDEEKKKMAKEFAYKVFEYLWDDVAKYNRDTWFNGVSTLDDLIENYVNEAMKEEANGQVVFNNDIFANEENS